MYTSLASAITTARAVFARSSRAEVSSPAPIGTPTAHPRGSHGRQTLWLGFHDVHHTNVRVCIEHLVEVFLSVQ